MTIAAIMAGTWSAAAVAPPAFPPLDHLLVPPPAAGAEINARPEPRFGEADYAALVASVPPARNEGRAWALHDTEWREEDERGYEAFVTAIGRSGCDSLDACLRSGANPYRDTDKRYDLIWFGDCADMAYVLRAYYAWKRGLPFAYATGVEIRGGNKRGGKDPRFSRLGNRVTGWRQVTTPMGGAPTNALTVVLKLYTEVHSGTFRTHPEDQDRWSDHYPVAITRESVRPGSIAYDVYGHVGLVYEVREDGRILIVSSHPDQTVTRGVFGANFLRADPAFGGGLKGWRPARLVGAKQRKDGTYEGGKVVRDRNEAISDHSLEGFYGTEGAEDWTLATFRVGERTYDWADFVRVRLRAPDYELDPIAETRAAYGALCADIQARKQAVDVAVRAGMPNRPAPDRLPENIYGTEGDWETYATPSRDARLKTQALEVRRLIEGFATDDARRGELADAAQRGIDACRVRYTRSDGSQVTLRLDHVVDRLWDLSFDPYHCPERRWGATGTELSSCIETPAKAAWYDAQTWLRRDPQRRYDQEMGFAASELADPATTPPEEGGLGRSTAPVAAVDDLLTELDPSHRRRGLSLGIDVGTVTGTVNER